VEFYPFPGASPITVMVHPIEIVLNCAGKCAGRAFEHMSVVPDHPVPRLYWVEHGCSTLVDALAWMRANACGIESAVRELMIRPVNLN